MMCFQYVHVNFIVLSVPTAPYGIREPTFRIGPSRPQKPDFKIKEEHLEKHIPAKQDYSLTEIFRDLMDFAVHQLEIGGRLG